MALKPMGRKWQKKTFMGLVIISVLISLLAFLVNSYWNPILAKQVKEMVQKSSDSLYNVSFSSAEIHVIRGTIIINNIILTPDTAKYNRLKKLHLAPNNLIEFRIKRLILSQIHPFTLYFKHQLEIGQIVLKQPVLHITYALNQIKDTTTRDRRTAWQKISKNLKMIHVGQILLGDIKFKYEDFSGNKVSVSELKELDLSAYDFLIDSASQNDKKRFLFCKNIVAGLNDYKGKTPNGLYNYEINSLKLSTADSRLYINGLLLNPVNSNTFFNHTKGDRFNLRIDSIVANNFDFMNFQKFRELNCSKLVVNGGAFQVYSNPNKLIEKNDRIKTFPNAALKEIKSNINIDSVQIKHFNVTYNEYNKKSENTGSVIFNNTNATVLNVTTNKVSLQKNNICNIKLNSSFMDRGNLDVDFDFNLTDENDSFRAKGVLGPMNLKYVNPAAIPLGMIKISSGILKQFSFDIKANKNGDRGNVKLLYNTLAVNVLKEDTILNKLKKKAIATLYANLFIVKHNNPDEPGQKPRTVYVKYVRAPETPFFKSLWQTLFAGIKPCVGFDSEKEKQLIAITKQQLENKENRKIKKELRETRREKRRQRREQRKFEKKLEQAEQFAP